MERVPGITIPGAINFAAVPGFFLTMNGTDDMTASVREKRTMFPLLYLRRDVSSLVEQMSYVICSQLSDNTLIKQESLLICSMLFRSCHNSEFSLRFWR
ncbi:hypothetical protein ACH3XW_9385 [Acanthocheilonema viteae]